MSNDDLFTTEYIADTRRIVLPRRHLPTSLVRVTRSVALLSLITAVAGLSPLVTGGDVGSGGGISVVVALVAAAFALLIWQGHSVVLCMAGRLTLLEQFGPILFQRSYYFGQLRDFLLTELPLATKSKAASAGLADETVTIVAAAIEGRGRRVMLFGYPVSLLRALVVEIQR